MSIPASTATTTATAAKRGRKPTPVGETKAQSFIRNGISRTTTVLDALDALSRISGSGYEYTDEQVSRIFAAIESATVKAKAAFSRSPGAPKPGGFSF